MYSKNIDAWNVVFYSGISLVNKLRDLDVKIYNFKKISEYKYYFETYRKNRRTIKKNFSNCKIISKRGMINYVEAMVTKTTFICIVLSSLVMHNVSSRIWKIEINGDYEAIENTLKEELIKNDLIVSKYYPDNNKLKEIEKNISQYLIKKIEFLELRRKGAVITLRYQKRREPLPLPYKGNNLYATKDGMIRYFNIQSGVKKVKEYDYVRKGDLLVTDIVETSSGESIDVGTLGSVFANTFYVIDVELNESCDDEAMVFSKMLDKAKVKIGEYLSKNEKIEIERVLNYSIEENTSRMKVYYMLLEDITI